MHNRWIATLMLALAASLPGCSMDPFLYVPKRTAAYVFEPSSDEPEEVVAPGRIERVWIDVDAEIRLGAVLVRAEAQPPRGHVMYFHGAGTHLDAQFWRIKRMSNLGYDVFAVDYRGFGASSDVQPTEEGIEADTRAARAWWLSQLPPGTGLVYYGHSFGGAVATQRAALDPPRAMILEAPFASVEHLRQDSTGIGFPTSFIANDTWDTVARIGQLQLPLLLAHGTADSLIRVEFGQAIFDAANEPKTLILVEGGQHGDLLPRVQEDYRRFLEDVFEAAP